MPRQTGNYVLEIREMLQKKVEVDLLLGTTQLEENSYRYRYTFLEQHSFLQHLIKVLWMNACLGLHHHGESWFNQVTVHEKIPSICCNLLPPTIYPTEVPYKDVYDSWDVRHS